MKPEELFKKAFKYEYNVHLRECVVKGDVIKYYYSKSGNHYILSLSPLRISHGCSNLDGTYRSAGLGRYTLKVLLNDYEEY